MNSTDTKTLAERKPDFATGDTISASFAFAIAEATRRARTSGQRQVVTRWRGATGVLFDVQAWR